MTAQDWEDIHLARRTPICQRGQIIWQTTPTNVQMYIKPMMRFELTTY